MWESRWSRKAKCDEVGAEERSGPPYPGATVNEDGAILLFSDDADERLELSDGGRGKIGHGNVSEAHGGMLRLPGGREGRLGEGDDVSDAESGRDEGFEIVFGGRSGGGEKIGNDPALRAGALVRSSAGGGGRRRTKLAGASATPSMSSIREREREKRPSAAARRMSSLTKRIWQSQCCC
jgi:hypothetical protein